MRKDKISTIIGELDSKIIEESAVYENKTVSMRKRWLGIAACFIVAVVGGTFGFGLLRNKPDIDNIQNTTTEYKAVSDKAQITTNAVTTQNATTPTVDVGNDQQVTTHTNGIAVNRNYKNGIISSETAIVFPWNYKTVSEQYIQLTIGETEYYSLVRTLSASKIGKLIGEFEVVGYDWYENDREHKRTFEVYEIKDKPAEACVAVRADGEYYIYATDEGRKLIEPAKQYQLAGRVTEIGQGYVLIDDTEMCIDLNDGMVFKVLTDDLRVRRCFEFQGAEIRVGSVVVVSFDTPITASQGNTVDGAIDAKIAVIADNGGVLIPE